MRKSAAVVAVAASTSGWAKESFAEAVPVRVRVDSALPECIAAHELDERVSPFLRGSEGAPVELAVTFLPRTPSGYRAEVVYRSPRGSRARAIESDNPDCHDLDEPLVVVVDALASEAGAPNAGAGEPSPAHASPHPVTRRDTPAERSVVPRASVPRVPHTLALGLGAELGALPTPAVTTHLDGRVALGSRFAARLGFVATPWASRESYSTATVDFRLTSGRLLGCFDWLPAIRGYVDTCLGLDGGAVTSRSSGFEHDATRTRPALWFVGEARAGLALGILVSEAFVSLGPALLRDEYRVAGAGGEPEILYRTAPFRVAAGFLVGAPLP
ncbi:MAG TPA: hypothetical protein VFZ53_11835 [Polyangiaceae bacterium]